LAYTPTTWVPGGPPGISAARLNNIEQGIVNLDVDLASLIALLTGAGIYGTNPPVSSNLDDERNVGWKAYDLNTIGAPHLDIPGFPNDGTVITFRRLTNRVGQLATGLAGNNAGRFAVRTLNSSGWGTWKEIWTTGNFDPSTKVDKSGSKAIIAGSYAGYRANADSGTNAEFEMQVNSVRRGMLLTSDSQVELRKYASNGTTIEHRLTLTSSDVQVDGSSILTRANAPIGFVIPLVSSPWLPFVSGSTTAGATDAKINVTGYEGQELGLHELVWDAKLAYGRSVYYEAMIGNASSGTTTYSCLRNLTNGTNLGTISRAYNASSEFGRVRSSAITIPDGARIAPALWSSNAYPVQLLWARLVII
jgi:hypothetical protein